MKILALATRNAHKAAEINAILSGQFRCLTLRDFPGAPETIEDAPDFFGNASKKALELAHWLRSSSVKTPSLDFPLLVLADDSGLEVDALNGAPGVHSARFAAADKQSGNSTDADNNAKLLRLLQNVPLEKRTARFRCVLALVSVETPQSPVSAAQLFDGVCEGRIQFAPRGQGGFGYDPLFIPDGQTQSFAELGEEMKNRISHRAQALTKLRAALVEMPVK